MSRTPISVQGILLGPDGEPATGTICATPSAPATNGATSYPAAPLCGLLDLDGRVVAQGYGALDILATDDEGTVPETLGYIFDVQIDGEDLYEFTSIVPAASTADEAHGSADGSGPTPTLITLADLVASEAMIGRTITGDGISGSSSVVAFDPVANTITIADDVIGGYSGNMNVTIGGAVSIVALMQDAS